MISLAISVKDKWDANCWRIYSKSSCEYGVWKRKTSHGRTNCNKISCINPLPRTTASVCQVLSQGYRMPIHISVTHIYEIVEKTGL